ncbi:MAG: tyrosine-type recombinase/integrase [Microthrixaceae bacterium]
MTRRGNGEGTVTHRKDGRWEGKYHVEIAGQIKRRSVYARTRAEAARLLREAQQQEALGLPDPNRRQRTGDYLLWWVENVAPATVKESTAEDYRWDLEHYVIPYIGRVPLAKLQPSHVQSMLRALEERGLSISTRRLARAVLRRALSHAERWGMVSRNAAALVDAPRSDGSRLDDALTLDEARSLLAAASGGRLEALVTVVLGVGLRKGEALALRWSDIDLEAATLTVRHTLKRRKGRGLVLGTTKNRSHRTLPMPDLCVGALRSHRQGQLEERLKAGPDWVDTDHVFTTPIGTPVDPDNLTKAFHRLCDEAGIGHRRFHALRHSAATIMHAAGVPLEVISKTLGHAGYSITADIYARVGEELARRAASDMDRALSGA